MKDNKGINIKSDNKDFKIPNNYFEQLKSDIFENTKSLELENKKKRTKRLYFTIPSYAAAAAILLLVTFKFFDIQKQDVIDTVNISAFNEHLDIDVEMEVYYDELAFISEDELIDMIIENELASENLEYLETEQIHINQDITMIPDYDYSEFDIIDEYISEDELIDLLIE